MGAHVSVSDAGLQEYFLWELPGMGCVYNPFVKWESHIPMMAETGRGGLVRARPHISEQYSSSFLGEINTTA